MTLSGVFCVKVYETPNMYLLDASIALESWKMVVVLSQMHQDGIYLILKHVLKGSIPFLGNSTWCLFFVNAWS